MTEPEFSRRCRGVQQSSPQDYYWTSAWQTDEREALAEIAAGKARTFAGSEAAIRYLRGRRDTPSHRP